MPELDDTHLPSLALNYAPRLPLTLLLHYHHHHHHFQHHLPLLLAQLDELVPELGGQTAADRESELASFVTDYVRLLHFFHLSTPRDGLGKSLNM